MDKHPNVVDIELLRSATFAVVLWVLSLANSTIYKYVVLSCIVLCIAYTIRKLMTKLKDRHLDSGHLLVFASLFPCYVIYICYVVIIPVVLFSELWFYDSTILSLFYFILTAHEGEI